MRDGALGRRKGSFRHRSQLCRRRPTRSRQRVRSPVRRWRRDAGRGPELGVAHRPNRQRGEGRRAVRHRALAAAEALGRETTMDCPMGRFEMAATVVAAVANWSWATLSSRSGVAVGEALDNVADGVRTLRRGRRLLQNLGPVDGGRGDGVHVEEALRMRRVGSGTWRRPLTRTSVREAARPRRFTLARISRRQLFLPSASRSRRR